MYDFDGLPTIYTPGYQVPRHRVETMHRLTFLLVLALVGATFAYPYEWKRHRGGGGGGGRGPPGGGRGPPGGGSGGGDGSGRWWWKR